MKIKKNLLIICEGQSTEPNYFHDLRNLLIIRKIDFSIVIRPKPPQQSTDEKKSTEFQLRKGVKKRVVADVIVDESDMVEEIYSAQPTRYVREAQLGLIDGTFEEAWAVYDLNGHTDHENAYNLARMLVKGKRVQVGFSSISFETWVLWHFERNVKSFARSQCRTGKKLHDCGQGINASDCHGSLCLAGYLKIHGYISPEKDVKVIRFSELADKVYSALTNAHEIRQVTIDKNLNVPFSKFIPYTTVDHLVFKMLQLPVDYQWITFDGISIPHFRTKLWWVNRTVNVDIENISDRTQIIHPDFVILINVKGETKSVIERRTPQPGKVESFEIDLNNHKKLVPVYIAFKLSDNTYQIIDLPLSLQA